MDDSVLVGNVAGLEVHVDFLGFKGVGTGGTYKYEKGGQLNYRVVVKNKGNISFQRLNVQSSLHSDGISCEKYAVAPGSLLPGDSISRLYNMSLATGDSDEFEASTDIPSDFCPSTGLLKIRLQYSLNEHLQASTLVAPLHFRIE